MKTLETKRLILRPFAEADAKEVSALCNSYRVYISTLSLPYPYLEEHALSWIRLHKEWHEKELRYEFALVVKETQQLIGAIGLSQNKQHQNGELGYWLGEAYWNKGYGTEAAQAILSFAFQEKQYHKIFALHFASNPASGRIMEKIGMTKEGYLKEQLFKEGKFEDIVRYGILNQEWQEKTNIQ